MRTELLLISLYPVDRIKTSVVNLPVLSRRFIGQILKARSMIGLSVLYSKCGWVAGINRLLLYDHIINYVR